MKTFAERVIEFNTALDFKGALPRGIRIMNPFKENREILPVTRAFYERFYNDPGERKIILGINPGRLGGGTTGIPFTDTKRLSEVCGIPIGSASTHEPSSVFVYALIERYGGAEKFYKDFYINSVCPLGFIQKNLKGKWINCNYYDSESLYNSMKSFITDCLRNQAGFGIDRNVCYVLGKKNARYVKRLNDREKLFDSLVVLDHPRYIVQYRSKFKEEYVSEYLSHLTEKEVYPDL